MCQDDRASLQAERERYREGCVLCRVLDERYIMRERLCPSGSSFPAGALGCRDNGCCLKEGQALAKVRQRVAALARYLLHTLAIADSAALKSIPA